MTQPRKPVILHLAVDFNTPQRPKTTTAIEWLVDELDEFDNVVIAYRRHVKTGLVESEVVPSPSPRYRLFDFPFFGLPLGLDLPRAMRIAAERTIALLEREGIRPDFVHAHKWTFEGLSAWIIARHFGVPYSISMRGQVETRVFRNKPLLRPHLRRVAAAAHRLYFVSAWYLGEFRRTVPGLEAKERVMPNIVRNIQPTIAPHAPGDRFVCIAALNTWKRKGLHWLVRAFADAARRDPTLRLDIIGGGSPESTEILRKLIAKHGAGEHITLVGRLPNAELLERLPAYRAMLLPSVNETFGMVYVEALFAGVPVLYTRDTGIDGYLDGVDVGVGVPAGDCKAIAEGVLRLHHDAAGYRARIAAAAPQLFATFDPAPVTERYRADVRAAIAANRGG